MPKSSNLQFCLIVLGVILYSTTSQADVIQLKNGQTLEGVLLSEDDTSYTVQLEVGKISIQKNQVDQVEAAPFDKNEALTKKWASRATTSANVKSKKEKKAEEAEKTSGKVHYKGKWLTQQEYKELKQRLSKTWDERVEEERQRTDKIKDEILAAENIKKTKELIKQGYRRRSDQANRILNEYEDWQSIKTDHFLIFFQDKKLGTQVEAQIETRFEEILAKLELSPGDVQLEDRIDIFLIQSQDMWTKALGGQYLADSPNHFTKIFRRELFLNLVHEEKLDTQLSYELSHICTREFVNLTADYSAPVPAWFEKGFANLQGEVIDTEIAKQLFLSSIKKGSYYPLHELVTVIEKPTQADEKMLVYMEAIEFMKFLNYSLTEDEVVEFYRSYLREFNHLYRMRNNQGLQLSKKDGKEIIKQVYNRLPYLRSVFSGIGNIEDRWIQQLQQV